MAILRVEVFSLDKVGWVVGVERPYGRGHPHLTRDLGTAPAKGHVHGAAALDASLEREQMVLSLELPLDAATGFERAPKTPQEKAMLDETAELVALVERRDDRLYVVRGFPARPSQEAQWSTSTT